MTDDELDQRVRESILAEDIDTSRVERAVRGQIQTGRLHVRGWAVAAAAVIAMVLAAGLSYRTFLKEQTPPLCIAAAQDHEREIVKGDPRRWLSGVSEIQSLAEKQGVPSSAIAALATTGYRLERGRLCLLERQVFLHLVFTRDGREYSVYLRPRGPESTFSHSVHEVGIDGDNLAYFETSRLTAVFVGHQPGASPLAFAQAGAQLL
jgi:hypothetical protein